MSDEPKQLKLTPRSEGEAREKKGKKEKEEKANKWMVVAILLLTVIASLIFYFSGKRGESAPTGATEPLGKGGGWFGPKVYQF